MNNNLKRPFAVLIVAVCVLFAVSSIRDTFSVNQQQSTQTAALFSLPDLQSQIQTLYTQVLQLQNQIRTIFGGVPVPVPTPVPPNGTPQCSFTRTLLPGATGPDVSCLQEFLATNRSWYPEGTVSGYFGALTEAAVQRFQEAQGIVTSGTPDTTGYGAVGPRTAARIAQLETAVPTPPPSLSSSVSLTAHPDTIDYNTSSTLTWVSSNVTSCIVSGPGIASTALSGSLSTPELTEDTTYSMVCSTPEHTPLSQIVIVRVNAAQGPRSCSFGGAMVADGSFVTAYQSSNVAFGNTCNSQMRTCTDGALSGSYEYSSCSVGSATSCTFNGHTVAHGASVDAYKTSSVPFGSTCPLQHRTCTNGSLSGTYQYASCSPGAAAACILDGITISHGQSLTFYSVSSVQYGQLCSTVAQSRTCTNGTLLGSTTFNKGACTPQDPVSCTLDGVTVSHGNSYDFYNASTVPYGQSCQKLSRTCTNGVLSGDALYGKATCTVLPPPDPSLTLTASPNSVSYGGSATVAWSATNATSCALSGGSITESGLTGSKNTGVLKATTNFTLTCQKIGGGIASKVISVSVDQPQTCTFNGTPVVHGAHVTAYQSPSVPFGSTCTSQTRTCSNGVLSGSYTNASCGISAPESCIFNGAPVTHGSHVTAFQSASVAYNQSCTSQTRTCTNGVLSGTYTNASCTVTAPLSCTFNGSTILHGTSVTAYKSSTVAYDTSCQSQTRTCTNGVLSGSYLASSCTPATPLSCTLDNVTLAHADSHAFFNAQTVAFGQSCQSMSRTCTNGVFSGSSSYNKAICTVLPPPDPSLTLTASPTSIPYGESSTITWSTTNTSSCALSGTGISTTGTSGTKPTGSLTANTNYTLTCQKIAGGTTSKIVSVAVGAPKTCTFNGGVVAHGASVTGYQSSTVPYGTMCHSQTRTCTNGVLSGTYTNVSCTVSDPKTCTFNGQTIAHGAPVTAYQATSVPYNQSCLSQTRTCSNGVLSGSYTFTSCIPATPKSCAFNGAPVAHSATVTAYQSATVPYNQLCQSQSRTCTDGTFSGTYTNASCAVTPAKNCTLDGVTVLHGQSRAFYSATSVPFGQACSTISQSRTCTNGTLSGSTTFNKASCSVAADHTPPTIAFSSPLSGAMVYGSVSLDVTATDNDRVIGVTTRIDGALVGSEDTTLPYTRTWNTLPVSNASHQLQAIARDPAGNYATTTRNVTVSNSPTLTIYVAPSGNDTNDGKTPGSAVATLTRAQAVAESAYTNQTSIIIKIAPGVYRGMKTQWQWLPATITSLTFEGDASLARPVFDGGSTNATWLALRLPRGRTWGVTIRHLKITNYRSAIIFGGSKEIQSEWSSGNLVEDNEFENIGQLTSGVDNSYSVIGFVNTRNSVVRDNTFNNIRNISQPDCGGLHIVYMSHWSSNNTIANNTVIGSCSDAFKARDLSNDNRIINNTFQNHEAAFFVDSYCYGPALGADEECTKLECPSSGNVVTGNTGNKVSSVSLVRVVHPDTISGCPVPTPTKARITTDIASCNLDGVTVPSGASHVFYNAATVPFGQLCQKISRTCTNSTLSGLTTYNIATCVVGVDHTSPTVAFSTPAAGATVSASVPILVTATDNDVVVGVTSRIDGVVVGAEDTTSPYTRNWSTYSTANGPHQLQAIARDLAGNYATTTRTVTVNNPAPIFSINPIPMTIPSGGSASITWVAQNVASCSVTGPGGFSASSLSGSKSTGVLTASSTYLLSCTKLGGGTVSAQTTVVVQPVIKLKQPGGIYFAENFEDFAHSHVYWDFSCTDVSHQVGAKYPALGQASRQGYCALKTQNGNTFMHYIVQPFDILPAPSNDISKGSGHIEITPDSSDTYAYPGTTNTGWDVYGNTYLNSSNTVQYEWDFRLNDATLLASGLVKHIAAGQFHSHDDGICIMTPLNTSPSPGLDIDVIDGQVKFDVYFKPIYSSIPSSLKTPEVIAECAAHPNDPCQIVLWARTYPLKDVMKQWIHVAFSIRFDMTQGSLAFAFGQRDGGDSDLAFQPRQLHGALVLQNVQTTPNNCPNKIHFGTYAQGYNPEYYGTTDATSSLSRLTKPNPTLWVNSKFLNDYGNFILGLQASGQTPPQIDIDYDNFVVEQAPSPILTLYASPTKIVAGNSSTIVWSAQSVSSCSISGPGVSGATKNGSVSTGALSSNATYTLTCQKTSGGTLIKQVTVTVVPDTTAPSVVITAPLSSATISAVTAVSATSSDNSAVAGVNFKIDATPIGTEDTASPYAVSLDTAKVPDGPHTLFVVARDAAGNRATSTRSVTIKNTVPLTHVDVYMSPTGNDSNNGSATSPVLTLKRAQSLVKANLGSQQVDATVHVAGGSIYNNQTVRWGFSMPNNTITIEGDPTNRPIFDGKGITDPTQTEWLYIARTSATTTSSKTNIIVRGLQIQNYHTPIAIRGTNSGSYDYSVGGNIIENNIFKNDGSAYIAFTGEVPSHAAIFITHSDSNIVRNNQFMNISDDPTYTPGYTKYAGLHALYVIASNNTQITGNTFKNIYSLNVIKFRDFSNFGKVTGNTFYDDTSQVGDQICGIQNEINCPKTTAVNECPSWGITFQNNTLAYTPTGTYSILHIEDNPLNSAFCNSAQFWTLTGRDSSNAFNKVTGVPRITTDVSGDYIYPSTSFTAPLSNALVSGKVTLSAIANDNTGVASVQFKVDNVSFGTDTTAPYSVAWDTTSMTNATHTLTAIVRDTAGNDSAATRVVTVHNSTITYPLLIYMSPTGDDAKNGRTQANAVKTLNRVQAILQTIKPNGDVQVRIAPGTYRQQTVIWTYTMPNNSITFSRLSGPSTNAGTEALPVFDGCDSSHVNCVYITWFKLTAAKGEASNIKFNYIKVQNYLTAISLEGNRDDFAHGWNSGNEIYGSQFINIGNTIDPQWGDSTAVVRFVNSRNNVVRNSHFDTALNVGTESPELLHAIYIAHNSINTQVVGNDFKNGVGDAVKVRDASDDAIIQNNHFDQTGNKGAISSSFCDGQDCTAGYTECPSRNTKAIGNSYTGNVMCNNTPLVVDVAAADTPSSCKVTAAQRLIQETATLYQYNLCVLPKAVSRDSLSNVAALEVPKSSLWNDLWNLFLIPGHMFIELIQNYLL